MGDEFNTIRRVIEHEDSLINHRFSWLILAQSFLLAAWFSYASGGGHPHEKLFALAGLASCILPYVSILAAVCALARILSDPEAKTYDDHFPTLSSPGNWHRLGLVGAVATPPVFIIIWLKILVAV